jgi:hypothetical protein
MKAYLAELHRMTDEINACHAEQQSEVVQATRERLTPLEDRLARVLATIPPTLQCEGLSLASLQAALKGRWRGHCHPGELGAALRKLGFERTRQWRGTTGFRAVWHKAS